MTTVRAIDPTTGGIITSGTQFITGKEAVAQTIKTRLKLFYGEYFRDIELGTPWFQVITAKLTNLTTKNYFIKKIITESPDVDSLLNYNSSFDIDTRTLTIRAEVLSQQGRIELEFQQGLTPLNQGVNIG